jgi:hypothetical protein
MPRFENKLFSKNENAAIPKQIIFILGYKKVKNENVGVSN